MNDIVYGAGFVVIGCLLVIFRAPLATLSVKFQNWFFGVSFNTDDIWMTKFGYLVFGVLAITVGMVKAIWR